MTHNSTAMSRRETVNCTYTAPRLPWANVMERESLLKMRQCIPYLWSTRSYMAYLELDATRRPF
jgi:hypothetical protein